MPRSRPSAQGRERAVFVGPRSPFANPFLDRAGINPARAAILYAAWLRGDCTPRVLRAAKFSEAEIAALDRWRCRVLIGVPRLRGARLICGCPHRPQWCHADALRRVAHGLPA